MADPSLNAYLESIPAALGELSKSNKNINEIAQYCKSAYASDPDPNGIFLKTQGYIKDALVNVAYHISNVGQNLTNFLVLQTKEINKLDLQIRTITDRLRVAKDTTGSAAFRTQEGVKPYQKRPKIMKLDDREIPVNSRPVAKYNRSGINLRILDTVGVDLQGNRGNDSYKKTIPDAPPSVEIGSTAEGRSGTFRAPPPINAPPLSAYSNTSVPPPLPGMNLPPPPAFVAPPPPMNSLPPPPGNFGMPDFGAPLPPPPDFGLPPPFDANELPPPPPPF